MNSADVHGGPSTLDDSFIPVPQQSCIDIFEVVRDMDAIALERIFDLYSSPLYKYAMCICHDPIEADQVVGDVFVKFMDRLSRDYGPIRNLRSYLFQMTRNLAIDRYHRSRREVPFEKVNIVEGENRHLQTNLEERQITDVLIAAAQNELTSDQRHVLILRFIEQFSVSETADILGKSIQNIKVIQNRAIAKLRRVFNIEVNE